MIEVRLDLDFGPAQGSSSEDLDYLPRLMITENHSLKMVEIFGFEIVIDKSLRFLQLHLFTFV